MARNSTSEIRLVFRLSRLYGVETSYYDVYHRRRQHSSVDSLLAILRSSGAPMATLKDAPSAWRQRQLAAWQRQLEPVIVCWEGTAASVEIRLPVSSSGGVLSYHLKMETGEERHGRWSDGDGAILQTLEVDGTKYTAKKFPIPAGLPLGYHRLTVDLPGGAKESLIISAPARAYSSEETARRKWGVFLPLYALRTREDWGSGDYSGLERLMGWMRDLGGDVVATLPMLAPVPKDEAGFSPYRPSTRLLWNEFYLDVNQVRELADCPAAQAIVSSTQFQNEIGSLRGAPLVDYPRLMALKRQVLEELSRHLFGRTSARLEELQRFSLTHPVVEDYARFCATVEKQTLPPQAWPQPLREGIIKEGDYDEETRQYHLYAQWLAHQQMAAVSETARQKRLQLYLDLPLGVHPDGYDVWRHSGSFMQGLQVGAPPDTVFTGGQNWQFPPLHPERIREQGYQYVIAYLRSHMEMAGILRIDHVMGFHRLFCIPEGMESSQGAYLHYPAEEFYAILALESQRHQTMIVGEDLGTVPPDVRPAMKRHGLNRMYVLRYELADDIRQGLHPAPSDSVASLNTHDMPPFASFWQGLDIEERLKLGLLDAPGAQAEKDNLPKVRNLLAAFLQGSGWLPETESSISDVLKAALESLAAGPAGIVLVNLEDLWLETQPQNVPSTVTEYPNWQRKMRLAFEEFCQMPEVVDILKAVAKIRQRANAPDGTERSAG